MILYKMIALQFGRFLETGRPGNEFDLVGRNFPTDETRINRRAFLSDLANARIYLLDHRAANYLDSLRMDVQGMPWETRDDSEIQAYVREVDFPRELVWVEYDARQLWLDRVTRGLTTMLGLDLALLHKPGDGQTYPFPGQTYPSTPVMGVPRAVKPLSTATLTWTSAT